MAYCFGRVKLDPVFKPVLCIFMLHKDSFCKYSRIKTAVGTLQL